MDQRAEPGSTGNAGKGPVLFDRAGGPAFLTFSVGRTKMIYSRITLVVACILFTVWLARDPGWEPLSALVLAVLGYGGSEFAQHKKEAKNSQDLAVVSEQRDEAIERESALREECRKKQEVIDGFHKRDRDSVVRKMDEVSDVCRNIAGGQQR